MNKMTLTVPAKDEWALVMRTSLSGMGALAKLSVEMIDDLRIACDEAFNLLTHQSQLIQHLVFSCEIKDGFLMIRLSVERAFASQMCTPVDPEVAHLIIGTLVTDVHLEGDSCGIYTVHMKVPTGTA